MYAHPSGSGDHVPNRRLMTGLQNSKEDAFEFANGVTESEYNRFLNGHPLSSDINGNIDILVNKYHEEEDPFIKGSFAYILSMSYYLGRIGEQICVQDKEKEIYWFIKSLQHHSPSAYWLAACASKAGVDCTDNFKIIRENMVQNGFAIDKKSADRYSIMAAMTGHPKAAWVLALTMMRPDDKNNKNRIDMMQEMGITITPELIQEMIVVSALGDYPDACWVVSQGIDKPHRQDSALLVAALIKYGKNPNRDLATQLKVTAALGGYPRACWLVKKALIYPHDTTKEEVRNELQRRKIDPTQTFIADLFALAALGGQPDACWVMSQVASYPEDPRNELRLKALARFNVAPDAKFISQMALVSAVSGHSRASGYCLDVLGKEEKDAKDLMNAMNDFGILDNDEFRNTLKLNAFKDDRVREKMSLFYSNADLIALNQKSLSADQIRYYNFNVQHLLKDKVAQTTNVPLKPQFSLVP